MQGFVFLKNNLRRAVHFLPLVFLGAALFMVHHEIQIHNLHDIVRTVHSTPGTIIGLAVALTVLNYLVLAGYDALALRYTGHGHIPIPKITLTSLISYAISNNTGHAWAAGGSIRYRFYTAWGVPGWDIIKISLFLGVTYLVGVMTLGLVVTLALPDSIRAHLQNPQIISVMMAACIAFLGLYWGGVLFWHKPLVVKGVEIRLPTPAAALGQTVIACLDLLLAGLVLWVFLAGRVSFGFETFLVIYILAQLAGLLSQIPGGLGIFEGAFLWLLSGVITPDEHLMVVSALVLYRVVYYFLPLGMAAVGLLAYELHARRQTLNEGGRALAKILTGIMPQVFAILLMLAGATLLVSAVMPAAPQDMQWLRRFVPLPVVEISHLLGSLTGLLLLFLARGIYLRLDAAWYGSLILLGGGVIFSLLKGLGWNEAAVLAFMFILLLSERKYFRRSSPLLSMPLSGAWVMMVAMVLAGAVWLGFFSYRHITYADALWWQFSYHGDAPRFLRALLLLGVVIACYMLARIFTVAKPRSFALPSAEELDEAEKLVRSSDETQGFLALVGDKKLFWGGDRKAFLMFADTAKYWIVMGNPVGDPAGYESLLWRFREAADRCGAKIVLYTVGEKFLPLYLDLGLILLKTGEEAKVRLSGFSLEGGRRETQRKTRNRFRKHDFTFAVLDRVGVIAAMPELKALSDKWLAQKNTQEKRFSLGFFDPAYIARTRVAVIRAPDGHIAAFANLWDTNGREEISIDLMRYDPDMPGGIMDFLFSELMLWGKEEGYVWFSLGVAPLSGLERHQLAPLWHKIGTAIYDLGDEFYNFEGLHDYKAKYDPVWLPRYLAAPAGLSAPIILMTVAKLVAGGWKRIFIK